MNGVCKGTVVCARFNALRRRDLLFVRENAAGNAATSSNQAELLVGELGCVGFEDHDGLELHLQCSDRQRNFGLSQCGSIQISAPWNK